MECYDQMTNEWYEVSLPDGPYWMGLRDVMFWDMNHDGMIDFAVRRSDGSEIGAEPSHPLHEAAADGDIEQVKLLISQNANLDVRDNRGGTPLHVATRSGRKDIVELLIAKGADVNVRTKGGRTPLDLAKRRGYTEIIELLREHGAKEGSSSSARWNLLTFVQE